MLKTIGALVLTLTLCGSAFAGDISSPPVAKCSNVECPPSIFLPVDIQANDSSADSEASATTVDVLAATALILTDSVLALF